MLGLFFPYEFPYEVPTFSIFPESLATNPKTQTQWTETPVTEEEGLYKGGQLQFLALHQRGVGLGEGIKMTAPHTSC